MAGSHTERALVIGCGALARELLEVTAGIPGLDVACLPPDLHNRPDGIPGAVRNRIATARQEGYERIFVAYADCGTGGLLEPVLAEAGVERLPGAHCYEVFAGSARFATMADAEPGTFWLTDFLARNFERLVIRGLGIDRHPELLETYFTHYTRVVFLSQAEDPDLLVLARRAADRLGLAFEHRPTGVTNLAAPILAFAASSADRAFAPSPLGPVFAASSSGPGFTESAAGPGRSRGTIAGDIPGVGAAEIDRGMQRIDVPARRATRTGHRTQTGVVSSRPTQPAPPISTTVAGVIRWPR